MARRWMQSVDLETDDLGRPAFESALVALAELIEDGRLKVDASGITLNVENLDIDVADITGAAPNNATLFDLKGGLTDVGTQINLVCGPDAETRKSLADVVGALAPLTNLASLIAGVAPDGKTLADLFDQIVLAQTTGRFFLSGGLYAGLGDIFTALDDVSNTVGGQNCVNAVLLGADGTFINETDYALHVAVQSMPPGGLEVLGISNIDTQTGLVSQAVKDSPGLLPAKAMAVELVTGGFAAGFVLMPDGASGSLYSQTVVIGRDPTNNDAPANPYVANGFLQTQVETTTPLNVQVNLDGFGGAMPIAGPGGNPIPVSGDVGIVDPGSMLQMSITQLGGLNGIPTGQYVYDRNGGTGWKEADALAYGFDKWAAAVIDPGQEDYYDGFANLYDNGSTAAFALTIRARQMAMQVQVSATAYTAGTIALEGSLDNGYWAVLDSQNLTATGTYLLQSSALARYVRLTVTNNNATDVTYQPVFYAQR